MTSTAARSGSLLDTNVLSELRKGARADPAVRRWHEDQPADSLFISVLTLGELRRGILAIARRDLEQAHVLEAWLGRLHDAAGGRILPVDSRVAMEWGRLMVPDPRPVIDALLAATAVVHGLTVVTRNVGDFDGAGVAVLDPFSA